MPQDDKKYKQINEEPEEVEEEREDEDKEQTSKSSSKKELKKSNSSVSIEISPKDAKSYKCEVGDTENFTVKIKKLTRSEDGGLSLVGEVTKEKKFDYADGPESES